MNGNAAIIGFGCAGYHAARALREAGFGGGIDVYSDVGDPPANPMLTTYYAGGRLPREAMFPFGELGELARTLDLRMHAARPVARLRAKERVVELRDGGRDAYEKILIATGAAPFVPPIGEIPSENVFYMRTPADADRLKARMDRGGVRRGLVVGASMAGIKVVELLRRAGADCLLADMAPRVFPLAAMPEVAAEIQRRLEAQGVELRFGVGLSGLCAHGGGIAARLGERAEQVDIAVLCIGTRPHTGFVDPAEILIDRGIVVDGNMRTSAPGIYAAGDCCAGDNLQSGKKQIIGLWANAGYQGRAAGYAMAGKEAPWEGNMPHNITHFMGMDFIGFGDVNARGELLDYQKPGGAFWLRAVMEGGRPACVNILDNYAVSGPIKNYMVKRFLGNAEPLSPMQQGVLMKAGLPRQILERLEGK